MARPKKQTSKIVSKKRGPKAKSVKSLKPIKSVKSKVVAKVKATKAKATTKVKAVKAKAVKVKAVAKKAIIKVAAPSFTTTLKNMAAEALARATQMTKEIEVLRVKADKANDKQKAAKDARVNLVQKLKNKGSATAAKQLAKAKDVYQDAMEIAEKLKKEFEAKRDALKLAKDESAKYKALLKVVMGFEKDWAATAKKAATVAKEKAAKSKKGRKPAKAASTGAAPKKRGRKPAVQIEMTEVAPEMEPMAAVEEAAFAE